MINLLPPDIKKQIRAARVNVILVNYCLLITATALLLGMVFVVGFWADMNDRAVAEKARHDNDVAAQAYGETRTQAETFSKDLGVAKTILANNVSFSQLILDIASVVPQGVILNTLSLDSTAATAAANNDSPIDISGRAKNTQAIINLKNSLEASPIFENVSIFNAVRADFDTLTDPTPTIVNYPYSISLKAKFSKKSTATGVNK